MALQFASATGKVYDFCVILERKYYYYHYNYFLYNMLFFYLGHIEIDWKDGYSGVKVVDKQGSLKERKHKCIGYNYRGCC